MLSGTHTLPPEPWIELHAEAVAHFRYPARCSTHKCPGHPHKGPLYMVWCAVVWCGVVWCGVVWCAMEFASPKQFQLSPLVSAELMVNLSLLLVSRAPISSECDAWSA